MINVNDFIEKLKENEDQISAISLELGMRIDDDVSFFNYLKGVDPNFLQNINIILIILGALQISNTEEIYDTYELEDIERIFDILLDNNKSDLRLWEEAIYFNHNVMSNDSKTHLFLDLFENELKKSLELINEIRSDLKGDN